ncbi:hypothetical protein [Sessilibacter corallicola]|uniref:Uncharacterized protein n=1 Tax=Sessilibacter corallicola TaxID=2904075 RepID=A0ABQ0ADN3_9GAMM
MRQEVIIWRDIEIQLVTQKSRHPKNFKKKYGYNLFQIQLKIIAPRKAILPICSTNNCLIITTQPTLNRYGGPAPMLTAVLNDKANKNPWDKFDFTTGQYRLF